MINGQIEFYDEDSEWGLILGDDGHLYELRSAQLAGPVPRVGDKVLFEPHSAAGCPAPSPSAAAQARAGAHHGPRRSGART
jgi:hypothetical protein